MHALNSMFRFNGLNRMSKIGHTIHKRGPVDDGEIKSLFRNECLQLLFSFEGSEYVLYQREQLCKFPLTLPPHNIIYIE